MSNLMSSEALCAHIWDSIYPVRNCLDQNYYRKTLDSFVSQVYGSSRPIELCKEISQIVKRTLSGEDIDPLTYEHLAFQKDNKGRFVRNSNGVPLLKHKSFNILNQVLNLPQSDARDKCLITLTKLHGFVLPLQVNDSIPKLREMMDNIRSPYDIPEYILNEFREFMSEYRFKVEFESYWDWRDHLYSLHNLAVSNYGSSKKKPTIHIGGTFDVQSYLNDEDSYRLPLILQNINLRNIYLQNKCEFMSLISGYNVHEVLCDDNIMSLDAKDLPIGRAGVRLQEAEKVRSLWMPLVIYTSLCNPITELLEYEVKCSKHQSVYLDDKIAANHLRRLFFPEGRKSDQLIYSIDQSAFTDNFPYKLQRIVLEEMYSRELIPYTSLLAFDQQVLGRYQPFTKDLEDTQFAKGTPMGAEGAFMLATLTHELLLRMLSKQLNIAMPKYMVQGDDCVLEGTELFNSYTRVMSDIGCSVNRSKTVVSDHCIEYCGYISTPTISVPMYRPHDRYRDLPKDVVSERALDAFTESQLLDWLLARRPEIIDQLHIAGLIQVPDYEGNQTYADARSVYAALVSYKRCNPTPMGRKQFDRLASVQAEYPVMRLSRRITVREGNYDNYRSALDYLKFKYKRLINDPYVNLQEISSEIMDISAYIQDVYRDFIPPQGASKIRDDEKETSKNPHKPDNHRDVDSQSVDKALNIATINKLNMNKEVDPHDENEPDIS